MLYKFEFKSVSPYFEKEREGIKPNTVREIDLNDDRFKWLIYWMMHGWNDEISIRIKRYDGNGKWDTFTREINDISVYKNLMIISWKHKKEGDQA
jgi:hypothetical protein